MALFLSLLLLSHVLSDYLFQTDEVATRKGRSIKYLTVHVLIWTGTAIILTVGYASWVWLKIIITLSIIHFVVDRFKTYCDTKWYKRRAAILLADQLIHIGVIVLAYPWLRNLSSNTWIVHILWNYIPLINYYTEIQNISPTIVVGFILGLAAFIFNLRGAPYLIERICDPFIPWTKKDKAYFSPKTGVLIGRLERTLVLTLVLLGQYTAIAMIFAAKSVVRLKDFEDQDFANYYIIGTLSSTMVALFTGIAIKLGVYLMQ